VHEFQSESVPARISALADARDIKAAGLLNNDGSMSEPGAIKPVKFTICGTRALSTCCVTHAPQSMEGDVYLQRGEFYLTRAAVENANAFFIANDSQLQYDTGMYLHRPTLASAVFGLAFGAALCPLRAHTRHFTYLYEATVSARGEVELENWVTWTGSSGENGRFNGFAFRHEVEFGVTDRFQLSLLRGRLDVRQ